MQALGLSFTVATLALAIRVQASGGLPVSWQAVLLTGTAFAGLWFGARMRKRISGPAFQRSLFIVFIGLGIANLLRGT